MTQPAAPNRDAGSFPKARWSSRPTCCSETFGSVPNSPSVTVA